MRKAEGRDPRTYPVTVDGTTAPIIKAIPKSNLEKELKGRGMSYADLCAELGNGRSGSGHVGEWIRGDRHMSNAAVVKTAYVLNVSPLYLLDLTPEKWPKRNPDPQPSRMRTALYGAMRALPHDGTLSKMFVHRSGRWCVDLGEHQIWDGEDSFSHIGLWLLEHQQHDMATAFEDIANGSWEPHRAKLVREILLRYMREACPGDYRDMYGLARTSFEWNAGRLCPAFQPDETDRLALAVTGAWRRERR